MSTTIDGSASVTINSGAVLGITSGTAVASTSGTSIDFTGIPSWVKRITVMFNGVSTSGTSVVQIQIGTSGGVQSSSYVSQSANLSTASGISTISSGWGINMTTATDTRNGLMIISLLDSSNGTWAMFGNFANSGSNNIAVCGGVKTLSGTLDRVRITTVNGTDTFDAGSINILYE